MRGFRTNQAGGSPKTKYLEMLNNDSYSFVGYTSGTGTRATNGLWRPSIDLGQTGNAGTHIENRYTSQQAIDLSLYNYINWIGTYKTNAPMGATGGTKYLALQLVNVQTGNVVTIANYTDTSTSVKNVNVTYDVSQLTGMYYLRALAFSYGDYYWTITTTSLLFTNKIVN